MATLSNAWGKFWLKAWLTYWIESKNLTVVRATNSWYEDHTQAVKILLMTWFVLTHYQRYDEITGVGHRVVAGRIFQGINSCWGRCKKKLRIGTVGPFLHNPANAAEFAHLRNCARYTSVVVFDTSSHKHAREGFIAKSLPTKYYSDNKVFVTGAHVNKPPVCRRRSERNFWAAL